MDAVKSFLFKLKLGLVLSHTLGIFFLRRHIVLIIWSLAILIVAFTGIVVIFQLKTASVSPTPRLFDGRKPADLSLTTYRTYEIAPDENSLQTEYERLQKYQSLQPSHRDLLINLSVLARALGNIEAADYWLESAKNIDPNFGLFKTLKSE